MLKRLEQQSLRADLAAVEAMLASRTADADPVGWLQFSRRKARLERELVELDQASPKGGIAMFFGGKPVVGAHGIAADFGAAMMGQIQTIVSVRSATLDGVVGERGPVPHRDKSQMFITDIARGSFGFVLEDAGTGSEALAPVMEDVCDLLARLGSAEAERFDLATESVDDRMLSALKTFFKTLDENQATLRLVSEASDFDFSREAIERAKVRTETMQVSDPYFETMTGRVFIMPDSKRFELIVLGGSAPIKGSISPSFVAEMFDKNYFASTDFVGKIRQVRLRVRETRLRSEAARKSYQLVSVGGPPEEISSEGPET